MTTLIDKPSRRRFSLLFLSSLLCLVPPAQSETPIFKDRDLEAAVRKFVFDKRDNDKPLTEADLANLSTIQAAGKDIADLTGLDKCRNLAALDLATNKIVRLEPLQALRKLQYLNLAHNQISAVSQCLFEGKSAECRRQEKPGPRLEGIGNQGGVLNPFSMPAPVQQIKQEANQRGNEHPKNNRPLENLRVPSFVGPAHARKQIIAVLFPIVFRFAHSLSEVRFDT